MFCMFSQTLKKFISNQRIKNTELIFCDYPFMSRYRKNWRWKPVEKYFFRKTSYFPSERITKFAYSVHSCPLCNLRTTNSTTTTLTTKIRYFRNQNLYMKQNIKYLLKVKYLINYLNMHSITKIMHILFIWFFKNPHGSFNLFSPSVIAWHQIIFSVVSMNWAFLSSKMKVFCDICGMEITSHTMCYLKLFFSYPYSSEHVTHDFDEYMT